jgi:hypothetical protein
MKKMKKILSFIVIAIIMTSCSSDNESSTTFKPSLTNLGLATKVPSSLEQNSPQTYSQISQMEAYMSMGSMYMNNTTGKSATTNTWTYGDYTVIYSYELIGNQYHFTYSMSQNSIEYFTLTGWENTDGSAGHWDYVINAAQLGDPDSSNFNITFDWTRSTIGDYHFDMNFDMGASNNLHYVTNINHDLSGNSMFSLNSVQNYGTTWNSTGHGQFTDYTTTPPTVTNF